MSTSPFLPDPEQARVLSHGSGPMLVKGAPGTGKTKVLRERFAALIEGGADPERASLVVRTASGRQASRSALLARLHRSLPGLRVTTMHGLAYDVVGRRFESLGYDRAPEIIPAGDQYARVRRMLRSEDPERWPEHSGMLGLRGFAEEICHFLLRAQEAMLSPEDVVGEAGGRGLPGWVEVGAFYGRYLDELARDGLIDFAGLLFQGARAAASGEPLFDHLLVDDYQEATLAGERLLVGLRAPDLTVAGDAGSHVFSFQGTTDLPLERFEREFTGSSVVTFETNHRSGAAGPVVEAWTAAHTSEEQAAIARELRRTHVEEGIAWEDIAVVVRRQSAEFGGLLRALDDAGVPRGMSDAAISPLAEPATFPYVLALRWLARPAERDAMIESLLTSDLARLSPASARGLIRSAVADGQSPAEALGHRDGLSTEEADSLNGLEGALAAAESVAARSALDAFAELWRGLPSSRRLVEESGQASRDLDAVVALSDALARASDRLEVPAAEFLDLLEAGEEGPGFGNASPRPGLGVRVLTAHGVAGDEFDLVIVAGAVEGSFPSLSRPEPMFDPSDLEHRVSQSERNRARLEDERRLFGVVTSRARRRVLLTATEAPGWGGEESIRSRFVAERALSWETVPTTPFPEPQSVAEARATWRRVLADPAAETPDRLAALAGILALDTDCGKWWFQRDWSGDDHPLHEDVRVSHSRLEKLENCDLQFALGQEIGLEGRPGYHAWVGSLVHKIIEDCEKGLVDRSERALIEEAERRWRKEPFPSLAVSEAFRRLVIEVVLPAWYREYGLAPALARELRFEFAFDGATVTGVIDRIGSVHGDGTQITDYKTGKSRNAEPAGDNLQLGIYYLAVETDEQLAEYRPVRCVELAFLRDRERDGTIARTTRAFTGTREKEFEDAITERLSGLIGHLRELSVVQNYRPNPKAACRFCDFKTLCPLFPEGRPLFPVEQVASRQESVG